VTHDVPYMHPSAVNMKNPARLNYLQKGAVMATFSALSPGDSFFTYCTLLCPLSTATNCCRCYGSRMVYTRYRTPDRSSQTHIASSECRPRSHCGSAATQWPRSHDTGTDRWWRHTLGSTSPGGRSHTLYSSTQQLLFVMYYT